VARGPRQPVRKSRPSESRFTGLSASSLFEADFGSAARHGTEAHADYEKIEWIDPAAPQDAVASRILGTDWAEAFVKPSADASVWRERSYELFDGTRWESGQFDRVVFTGTGAERRAVIYDFKTNGLREGESVEKFEDRLRKTYEGQMTMYVAALSRLTGISQEHIGAKLLASASMSVIVVK